MIIEAMGFLGKISQFVGDWLVKTHLFGNHDLINEISSVSITLLLTIAVPLLTVYFVCVVLPRSLLAYYDVKWEKKLLLKDLANALLGYNSEVVHGIVLDLTKIAAKYQPNFKGEEADKRMIDASPINLIGRLRKTISENKKIRDELVDLIYNVHKIKFGLTFSKLRELEKNTNKFFSECDKYIIEHQKQLDLLKAPNEILDGLTKIYLGLIKKRLPLNSINHKLRALKPNARLARWRDVARDIKNTLKETA